MAATPPMRPERSGSPPVREWSGTSAGSRVIESFQIRPEKMPKEFLKTDVTKPIHRLLREQNIDDLPMQSAVRRNHASGAGIERAAIERSDHTARLSHDEGAGRGVPLLQVLVPEAIHPPAADIAEI